MRVIVHVGPIKTGSTSVQSFVRRNSDNFAELGIISLTKYNLPRIFGSYFKDDLSTRFVDKKFGDDNVKEKVEAFVDEKVLASFSEVKKPTGLIISSEGLGSASYTTIEKLKNWIHTLCKNPNIIIVYYWRKPEKRYISGLKNKIHNRKHVLSLKKPRKLEQYDNNEHISRLRREFKNVYIVNFDDVINKKHLSQNVIAHSFYDILRENFPFITEKDKDRFDFEISLKNAGSSHYALHWISILNYFCELQPFKKKCDLGYEMREKTEAWFSGVGKFYLPPFFEEELKNVYISEESFDGKRTSKLSRKIKIMTYFSEVWLGMFIFSLKKFFNLLFKKYSLTTIKK